MNNLFKAAAVAGSLALVGASVYIMSDNKLKKKASKKINKAVNTAEDMVQKALN